MANITGLFFRLSSIDARIYQVLRIVDFDVENSIPTLFSFLNLLLSAGLLFLISIRFKDRFREYLPWLGLAFVFLFLSLDEILSIHENFIEIFREKYNFSGLLYFSWVIPYGIGLLVFLLIYFPFFLKLPKRIKLLFAVSGFVFVSGAIGMELFGGRYYEQNGGNSDLTYSMFYTLEELLEMLGITFFNYALLSYIAIHCKEINVKIVN
ncbi:hypothetical protein [Flagellimonas sp.]|uniref:hypothetical protein n=1 Tax=Flagellimonas sp. TaxID=2058762 RepID=UPI003B594899